MHNNCITKSDEFSSKKMLPLTTVWRTGKKHRLLLLVPFCWLLLVALIVTVSPIFRKEPNDLAHVDYERQFQALNARLNEVNHEIEVLMEQNKQLAQELHALSDPKNKSSIAATPDNSLAMNAVPDTAYELSLRRLKQNTDDLWHHLRHSDIDEKSLVFVNQLRYNMFYEFDVLTQRDNRWREQQLKNLSDFVHNRIQGLQNPSDCKTAKKLFCDLNKRCGFGCQAHHLAHCLLASMALNRTLVVKSDDWRTTSDSTDNVWTKVFRPFSETCVDFGGHNHSEWKDDPNLHTYQVIHYPIIDYISPVPPFLPFVIPTQISESITRLSGQPFIWFIGQVLRYLLRPSDQMQEYIEDFKRRIHFKQPIVGIHVRRTDKIDTEATFHAMDEYMIFVEDFYNKHDLKNERKLLNKTPERRVYLATDEPDVWRQEITPFENRGYMFIGDIKLAESADPSLRDGFDSLHGVVVDLLLLSECDYIVCTFSSQVCRLAFELMQSRSTAQDMSSAFYSVDDIYYFGGQAFHGVEALVGHWPQTPNELSFQRGDIVGVANNEHNGYNYGEHNRTKIRGRYPRFKVTEYIQSKPFAIFY